MERGKQAFKATLKPGLQGNAEARASRERWKQAFKVTLKPGLQGNAETRAPMERWKQAFKVTLKPGLQGNAETRATREPWKPWNPWKPCFWKPENFENFENLEPWNCLHKTFRASTWEFKRWCDLRANLHYGLNFSKFCVRPWPSCANKCSAHSRPNFGWNLKFLFKFLKNLNLGIVCTRRSAQVPEISNGGVTYAPTCTMD